jgi:hypothetical protein
MALLTQFQGLPCLPGPSNANTHLGVTQVLASLPGRAHDTHDTPTHTHPGDAGDGNGALVLDEFLDAKEVVAGLAAEYEACERSDYVSGCSCWRSSSPLIC